MLEFSKALVVHKDNITAKDKDELSVILDKRSTEFKMNVIGSLTIGGFAVFSNGIFLFPWIMIAYVYFEKKIDEIEIVQNQLSMVKPKESS